MYRKPHQYRKKVLNYLNQDKIDLIEEIVDTMEEERDGVEEEIDSLNLYKKMVEEFQDNEEVEVLMRKIEETEKIIIAEEEEIVDTMEEERDGIEEEDDDLKLYKKMVEEFQGNEEIEVLMKEIEETEKVIIEDEEIVDIMEEESEEDDDLKLYKKMVEEFQDNEEVEALIREIDEIEETKKVIIEDEEIVDIMEEESEGVEEEDDDLKLYKTMVDGLKDNEKIKGLMRNIEEKEEEEEEEIEEEIRALIKEIEEVDKEIKKVQEKDEDYKLRGVHHIFKRIKINKSTPGSIQRVLDIKRNLDKINISIQNDKAIISGLIIENINYEIDCRSQWKKNAIAFVPFTMEIDIKGSDNKNNYKVIHKEIKDINTMYIRDDRDNIIGIEDKYTLNIQIDLL